MPPCPLAWLPQQIAAPRRNQTNDSLGITGKACAAQKIEKKRSVSCRGVHSTNKLVDETTHLSMGQTTEAARSPQTATDDACRAPRAPAAQSATRCQSQ